MQKSYQSRLFQKSEIVFVQNRQFCQLPFLPARTIILAIDSNGAVGHLLTRSAVLFKKLSREDASTQMGLCDVGKDTRSSKE